jgi:feruloyl-CoA synthase
VLFATADVRVERRGDGSILLNATQPLGPYPRSLSEHLLHWAQRTPERAFLLERGEDEQWRGVRYKQALDAVLRIAGGLLALRISAQRPIGILSENSVEHGLLMLAAMYIGVRAPPISSAYSLASRDFGKLKSIIQRTTSALVYVADYARYAPALAAIRDLHDAIVVVGGEGPPLSGGMIRFEQLHRDDLVDALARAFESVTPDTVAKVLFTSRSTDEPKGSLRASSRHSACCAQTNRPRHRCGRSSIHSRPF